MKKYEGEDTKTMNGKTVPFQSLFAPASLEKEVRELFKQHLCVELVASGKSFVETLKEQNAYPNGEFDENKEAVYYSNQNPNYMDDGTEITNKDLEDQ